MIHHEGHKGHKGKAQLLCSRRTLCSFCKPLLQVSRKLGIWFPFVSFVSFVSFVVILGLAESCCYLVNWSGFPRRRFSATLRRLLTLRVEHAVF